MSSDYAAAFVAQMHLDPVGLPGSWHMMGLVIVDPMIKADYHLCCSRICVVKVSGCLYGVIKGTRRQIKDSMDEVC